jgi:protein gp37
MATKIEWCKSDDGSKGETWNPAVGCTKISPGCTNCYAEKMALRLAHMARADIEAGRNPGRKRHYLEVVDLERRRWNGKVALVPEALGIPLRWRKPRRVFVCSMGDLFHKDVPGSFIERVWQTMFRAKDHTFMVLTKRPQRMLELVSAHRVILSNTWLGVTAENQKWWERRRDAFFATPAAVHFVSYEPALGPLIFSGDDLDKLDWVIIGGETSPGARPMHPDWARSVRDQCIEAGVPFFFKSWGDWLPYDHDPESPMFGIPPDYYTDPDAGYSWTKVGKKRAGRLLDGRKWEEYPDGGR